MKTKNCLKCMLFSLSLSLWLTTAYAQPPLKSKDWKQEEDFLQKEAQRRKEGLKKVRKGAEREEERDKR